MPPVPVQPPVTDSTGRVRGVVVGCRRDDGRWLLIRRGREVMAPLTVCFPGGGMQAGETPAQAAVREMREELGVGVTLLRQVWDWDAPDRPLHLLGWLGRLADGEIHPDPHEVAQVLWLTADEVRHHPDRLTGTEVFVGLLEREIEAL